MKRSSTTKCTLLSIGMLASSSMAFATTSSFTVNALFNGSTDSSDTYAMVLAGVGLMVTIARRSIGHQG